jgi:hypothetical protein
VPDEANPIFETFDGTVTECHGIVGVVDVLAAWPDLFEDRRTDAKLKFANGAVVRLQETSSDWGASAAPSFLRCLTGRRSIAPYFDCALFGGGLQGALRGYPSASACRVILVMKSLLASAYA